MIVCMLLVVAALAGCVSSVDDSHPFAGEWTTQGGLLMVFMESDIICDVEWNVAADTAENVVDCMDISGIKTTTTWNYTFVGEVLFMQSLHLDIEQSDGNNSSTDTSNITICAAYVPRDIAPDEASWKAEVNAVTWPDNCTEIAGMQA